MKPRVIVEQLYPHEHIWDNSLLKLPTILSSPSLDCSTQYKEMLNIVAAELESDIQNFASEDILSVKSPNHHSKNLNVTYNYEEKEIRIQRRNCKTTDYGCIKSSVRCQNSKRSQQQSLFSSSLLDPFDDFVSLNDTQQLLKNCNVFHNYPRKAKAGMTSPSLSLQPVGRPDMGCIHPHYNCRCPHHFNSRNLQPSKS